MFCFWILLYSYYSLAGVSVECVSQIIFNNTLTPNIGMLQFSSSKISRPAASFEKNEETIGSWRTGLETYQPLHDWRASWLLRLVIAALHVLKKVSGTRERVPIHPLPSASLLITPQSLSCVAEGTNETSAACKKIASMATEVVSHATPLHPVSSFTSASRGAGEGCNTQATQASC